MFCQTKLWKRGRRKKELVRKAGGWCLTLLLVVWGIPNPEPLSTSPIRKSETLRSKKCMSETWFCMVRTANYTVYIQSESLFRSG